MALPITYIMSTIWVLGQFEQTNPVPTQSQWVSLKARHLDLGMKLAITGRGRSALLEISSNCY